LPRKKKKPAHEKTTEEAIRDLFHPDMADALKDAVSEEEPDEMDDDNEPTEEA